MVVRGPAAAAELPQRKGTLELALDSVSDRRPSAAVSQVATEAAGMVSQVIPAGAAVSQVAAELRDGGLSGRHARSLATGVIAPRPGKPGHG